MPDERGTVRNGLLGDCAWPSKNQASCTFIVMVAFIAGSLYMVPGVGNVIPGDRKFLSGRHLSTAHSGTEPNGGACASCDADPQPASAKVLDGAWAPRSHIFDQFTIEEADDIKAYVTDTLRLTDPSTIPDGSPGPQPTQDILYRIEPMPPPKAAAVAYLDGHGPEPERFAHVITYRGTASPRDIMEYRVGPLPVSNTTTTIALRAPGEIPFVKHPVDSISGGWGQEAVGKGAFELKDIFLSMTGGYCYASWVEDVSDLPEPSNVTAFDARGIPVQRHPCDWTFLSWLEYPVLQKDMMKRVALIKWQFVPEGRGGEEAYLHPLPLSFKMDQTDPNPSLWRNFDFEYCHQGPFDTAAALLEAFSDGSITRCSAPAFGTPGYDYTWATTDPRRLRAGNVEPGPRQYSPRGLRFAISSTRHTGRRFRWFGWEGHVTLRGDTGIALHDVTYKGRRILYELSHQDMYVSYSGYGGDGQTFYLDSAFGIGQNTRALKRGYDCPWNSAYLGSELQYGTAGAARQEDVICMFEDDMASPTWRHTHVGDSRGPHADGARAVEFVVRTVATIGNYDYMFDVRFKRDASIEVKVTMAGYMSTLFFDPGGGTRRDTPFGTRVHTNVLANLHDHLSGWKVDLDVAGVNNTFLTQTVKAGTFAEALKDVDPGAEAPGWISEPVLKYISTRRPDKEVGLVMNASQPTVWQFVNEKETNAWGMPRGYVIQSGVTTAQLLPPQHPLTKAAAWTKYHLAVTRSKDNEYRSHASMYDFFNPADAIVNLDNYLDGESVTNTDLIGWVTIGVQHIPRAEDVPLISNFGANFYIKPWNYFDSMEAIDTDSDDTDEWESCLPDLEGAKTYKWSFN
uniref:Amine oxidase n=1 Tax=Auxenochlorella protothecoides TaxID=3075 RepID=A0A1D1ZP82_AUXPR